MSLTKTLRRIDDADLDVYQYRLLMHYLRVGQCWEKIRTTAERCSMSTGKVSEVRAWLLEEGWIEWVEVDGRMALALCSPDEQIQQLSSPHEQDVHHMNNNGCSRSPHEQECSPDEQICSPHEQPTIKSTSLRIPSEGKEPAPATADREILAFLDANGIDPPATPEQWEQLLHPAIVTWLSVTGRWPSYGNLPFLINELGERPSRPALERAWSLWKASDNKPGNLVGVIDWYKDLLADPGWSPGNRFKPTKNGKAPPVEVPIMTPIKTFEGGGGIY